MKGRMMLMSEGLIDTGGGKGNPAILFSVSQKNTFSDEGLANFKSDVQPISKALTGNHK
jgi:hypothetical protein